MSPLMGVSYTGHYEGKLLWIHHTHDSSLWPSQGVIYEGGGAGHPGGQRAPRAVPPAVDRERRAHRPAMLPSSPVRATTTWLIDYIPDHRAGAR